jgi:hypothetical protein
MKNMALIVLITLTSSTAIAFANLGSLGLNGLTLAKKLELKHVISKSNIKNNRNEETKKLSYFDNLRSKFRAQKNSK